MTDTDAETEIRLAVSDLKQMTARQTWPLHIEFILCIFFK
jgi:hypothetical protein